jgi:hypothetical protein
MATQTQEMEDVAPGPDPFERMRAYLSTESSRVAAVMDKLRACYIGSGRDDAVKEELDRLIENSLRKKFPRRPDSDDNRKPGVGFVIVGGSGSGKTEAVERILVDHPVFPGYGIGVSGCTLVSVLAPSPTTLALLGHEVLTALGYPPEQPLREAAAWNRVRKILKRRRVTILHIDDVHNVLQRYQANPKELSKIQSTFRNLLISRDWPVQLILSGVGETLDIFQKDRQLKRRLRYVMFDDLVIADDAEWVTEVAKDFVASAGLKYVEQPGAETVERLIHAAAYQFGLTFEVLLDGIEAAVKAKNKTFGIDDLAKAYEKRTSQPKELNIFASPGWQVIDPSIIFEKENDEEQRETNRRKAGKIGARDDR